MTHTNDHGHPHSHDHDHDHPHGMRGAIKEIFAPHSHDSADSVDGALESSAAGIRAVKVSLLVLGVTALHRSRSSSFRIGGAGRRHHPQFLRRSDRRPALDCLRAGHKSRYPPLHLRIRPRRGPCRTVRRRDDHAVGDRRRLRGDPTTHPPQPIENVGWVALAGLVGFVGNEWVALYRVRVGRRIGSAALVADGLHARTDGFTSLAVLVGAGGVALGFPLADPIVGLVITVAILAVLRTAVRDVFRRLIDGVEPELVDAAEAVLAGPDRGALSTQRPDALDRASPTRRRRTRRRPHAEPGCGTPHRTRQPSTI